MHSAILIVGGGVAGCSLAFELGRRGVAATLVERGRIGRQGASSVGVALLNPFRGRSARPGRHDLEGLAAFWRMAGLLEAAGLDSGASRSGVLRLPSSDRQARIWGRLEGMEPLVPPPPYRAPHGAFLVPDGGWVAPRRLLEALATAARDSGCSLYEGCLVEELERRPEGWLAHSERGSFEARVVVLCPGAGTVAGTRLPELELVAGELITLDYRPPLPYPIAGGVYLASTGASVQVGGNHRDPQSPDPRAPELLRASAARMVPPLASAPVVDVWSGVRARPPDNVPLLTELEPGLWFLGGFGGRGFLTAPLLAARLASRLAPV